MVAAMRSGNYFCDGSMVRTPLTCCAERSHDLPSMGDLRISPTAVAGFSLTNPQPDPESHPTFPAYYFWSK
jgi:hypothetical protein